MDGKRLKLPGKVYFLVNKPMGYLCSSRRDRTGKPLLTDLVMLPELRLFSVGRLDVQSKGAIILTNDGDFANRISHPRYDVPKTYRVRVEGDVTSDVLEKLRKGVWLSEGKATPTDVRVISQARNQTLLRITLSEGKNRIIRRVLAKLKLKVTELERTRIGPIALGSLKPGQSRRLNRTEVQKLLTGGLKPRSRRKPRTAEKTATSRRDSKKASKRGAAPSESRLIASRVPKERRKRKRRF